MTAYRMLPVVVCYQVNATKRSQLFNMVTVWVQSIQVCYSYTLACAVVIVEQVIQQRLGVQLVGVFCEAEGPNFSKRISSVLPLLSECLNKDDVSNIIMSLRDSMILLMYRIIR